MATASYALKRRSIPFVWTIQPPRRLMQEREEFEFLITEFVNFDVGRDGMHPGRRSHAAFANNIVTEIADRLDCLR